MKKTVFDAISDYEIIDFHTHPFRVCADNICAYRELFDMTEGEILPTLRAVGIDRFAGTVICCRPDEFGSNWEKQSYANRLALQLRDEYQGAYIPGFHINPAFVEESVKEIEYMAKMGVTLCGELVPYHDHWERYDDERLHPIMDALEKHGMVLNIHSMAEETIGALAAAHPNLPIVVAHPGEKPRLDGHIERMKKHDNLFLDISGTGVLRYRAVGYTVKQVGAERVLFGTDYPTCNPGGYIGALLCEGLSERENRMILSENAKKLLKLT